MSLHVGRFLFRSKFRRYQSSWGLVYREHGVPEEVVHLEELPTVSDKLNEDQVRVSMIAAPINPSDINQIQGTYPLKPSFPAVGGNEGVGKVVAVGSKVTNVREGDLVIPCVPEVGTWRSSIVETSSKFISVNPNVSTMFAATMQVNPPTAYRMLKDFVNLTQGDTVIQNGANSAVGQCVIQLAAAWGLRTINLIRTRTPETEHYKLVDYLKSLGATEVVTEEFAASYEMKELMKSCCPAPPPLALNCVGGKSSTTIAKYLANGGTHVTYGGMSKQPVTIPTSLFIFKEIHCTGYWNSEWLKRNLNTKKHLIEEMIKDLCQLSLDGQLKPPLSEERQVVSEYRQALSLAMKPFATTKQVLLFPE